jgi:hypothetical protein
MPMSDELMTGVAVLVFAGVCICWLACPPRTSIANVVVLGNLGNGNHDQTVQIHPAGLTCLMSSLFSRPPHPLPPPPSPPSPAPPLFSSASPQEHPDQVPALGPSKTPSPAASEASLADICRFVGLAKGAFQSRPSRLAQKREKSRTSLKAFTEMEGYLQYVSGLDDTDKHKEVMGAFQTAEGWCANGGTSKKEEHSDGDTGLVCYLRAHMVAVCSLSAYTHTHTYPPC